MACNQNGNPYIDARPFKNIKRFFNRSKHSQERYNNNRKNCSNRQPSSSDCNTRNFQSDLSFRPNSELIKQNDEQTGTLKYKTARLLIKQYEPPVPATVRSEADHPISNSANKPEQTPTSQTAGLREAHIFRVQIVQILLKKYKGFTRLFENRPRFPFQRCQCALHDKAVLQSKTTYRITATVMRTAHCLFNTGAGVNFIQSLMILIN